MYIGIVRRQTENTQLDGTRDKGAITSKIKHAIQLKTSPARLAQLLQPSWTVRRHWLHAKKC